MKSIEQTHFIVSDRTVFDNEVFPTGSQGINELISGSSDFPYPMDAVDFGVAENLDAL